MLLLRALQHVRSARLALLATNMPVNVSLVMQVSIVLMAPLSAQLAAPASMRISVSLVNFVPVAPLVLGVLVLARHATMAHSVALGPQLASPAPPEGCSPHTALALPAKVVAIVPELPTLTAV